MPSSSWMLEEAAKPNDIPFHRYQYAPLCALAVRWSVVTFSTSLARPYAPR